MTRSARGGFFPLSQIILGCLHEAIVGAPTVDAPVGLYVIQSFYVQD